MPRRPDPKLEERILDAAQKLLRRGSERALTMRAVAQAAGTNTPALYRRFRDRREVIFALLRRLQNDSAATVRSSTGPAEACEHYLEFALQHRNEYELFFRYSHQLPKPMKTDAPLREYRPTMRVMEEKLAETLGGCPKEHSRLSLALWALTHGTAMILISKSIPAGHASELRSVFSATVRSMLAKRLIES